MKKWNKFVTSAVIGACMCSQAFASYSFQGIVSWYGRSPILHTANQKFYSHYDLMAASRTLPFGTKVKVTNLLNHKSVVVTIVDRGPYVKGRSLDLFYGAALRLGMIKKGVIPAKISILSIPGKTHHTQSQNMLISFSKYENLPIKAINNIFSETLATYGFSNLLYDLTNKICSINSFQEYSLTPTPIVSFVADQKASFKQFTYQDVSFKEGGNHE